MNPELIYFLKVNVAMALFYAFYRLFCCKDTFFSWRRIVLLVFLIVSFIYPFLNIQEWVKQQEPINDLAIFYANVVMPEITVRPQIAELDYSAVLLKVLGYAYLCGVAVLTVRFLVQLASISLLAFRSNKSMLYQIKVRLLRHQAGPFSFFNWIFIHPQTLTNEEIEEILTHERTHARQLHSLDVILSELVCIVCWINPFSWLLKQEIRRNLEYMADNKVVRAGHDFKSYQYHLLGLAHHKAAANLYNNFNVLPIKNRIMMMNKKRTKNIGRVKYIMFLPLAALLLLVSNIEAVARIGSEISEAIFQEKIVTYKGAVLDESGKPLEGVNVIIQNTQMGTITDKNGKFSIEALPSQSLWFSYVGKSGMIYPLKDYKDGTLKINLKAEAQEYKGQEPTEDKKVLNDPTFMVVEVMPEYPGGAKAMMEFLSSKIKYPENAKKNGIEGRVITQFVVDTDGMVIEPTIVRSVSPELDAEALRVIRLMPKWKPGTQRGKAVKVKYTVPVTFSLPKDNLEGTQGDLVVVGTRDEARQDVYNKVDAMPEFPGGMSKCMVFLAKNTKYPAEARASNAEGRVIVQFIVEEDGSISNLAIAKGVNPYLDAEAVRVVSIMPQWKPGMKDGKPVRVKFTIPVTFRLSSNDSVTLSVDNEPTTKPLVIVDGVKHVSVDSNLILGDLKAEDIENIKVLKDEQAINEYGEAGKDGVIIVTTKKHKNTN